MMSRSELLAVINQPAQIRFTDEPVIEAVVREVGATQFSVSDEKGPHGWIPSGPYDIADVHFARPWPPKLDEEQYLYSVAVILRPFEPTDWPHRFAVKFASARGAVTLVAVPGSVTGSVGPELVFEPAYAADEPSASEFEQRSLASTEPVQAARQIRQLLGMPVGL
jgi:hypothetical protein